MQNLLIISVSSSFLGATPTSISIRGRIDRNIHPPCLMLLSPGLACKLTGPPKAALPGFLLLLPVLFFHLITAPFSIALTESPSPSSIQSKSTTTNDKKL